MDPGVGGSNPLFHPFALVICRYMGVCFSERLAGINDILMIIGKGKRAIEEHFDRSFQLEVRSFLRQLFAAILVAAGSGCRNLLRG